MSNKCEKRVTLLDIPDEIMRYISRFLTIEDFLHLSLTCKRLYHMLPRYIFEYKMIYCPESGPSIWTPDFGEIPLKGHGDPWPSSFYFDTPPFTSHIFMATISGRISGQGNIDLQLIRPHHVSKEPITIEHHYNILSSQPGRPIMGTYTVHPRRIIRPSPYSGDLVKCFTFEDPIIDMIQPGDYFRFMKIDGREENPLRVENFRVHTRGLRNIPTIVTQKSYNNALTQYSVTCSERLHTKKDCFANIVKKFKKKDKTEMKGYRLAHYPDMSVNGIAPRIGTVPIFHTSSGMMSIPPTIPIAEQNIPPGEYHDGIPPFNINDYL